MAITFPNASRSFDATRGAIRFWGHDSAMEASFLITSGALHAIEPNAARDENSLLAVFDRHRLQICQAAARVYTRGRKAYYELDAGHF